MESRLKVPTDSGSLNAEIARIIEPCNKELTCCLWVDYATISYRAFHANQATANFKHSRGEYGQDVFTLKRLYFQGLTSPSVNIHWRRFATSSIPKEAATFDAWLQARWREKDALLETFATTGRFPADADIEHIDLPNGAGIKRPLAGAGYIETYIKPRNPLELLQIFAPMAGVALCLHLIRRVWNWFLTFL